MPPTLSSGARAVFYGSPEMLDRVYAPNDRQDASRLIELVQSPAHAQVMLTTWGAPRLDADFLAQAPALELVLYAAGSVRGIVTDALWDRGVRIVSAFAMNAVPVSEYTLGAILLSLKHVWRYDRLVRSHGAYPPPSDPPGAYHSRVGLVSLGQIGRLVAQRLRPFDLEVIAYDPFCPADVAAELGVSLVSLDALFRTSDVVSLHTPWLPQTQGMITGELLASMKPGSTFLNTARGAVVNEPQMIRVMQERPDVQFVLDVTHPEPPAPGSPLYQLPNVVLTPHIAGSIGRECYRMGRFIVDELRRYLAGEPLKGEVTREAAALLA